MPNWISIDEAVTLSGYNAEYIRRLIRGKRVYAEKKGWQWWIDQRSLAAYLHAARKATDKRRGPK
jgi:hypothetical protein